jgi:hypothetical protein
MELKGIKEFLERYKTTLLKGDFEREEIVLCIKDVSGVTLKSSEFKIERLTLTLRVTPIKKNQIFLYRDKILSSLKEKGIKTVSEIR